MLRNTNNPSGMTPNQLILNQSNFAAIFQNMLEQYYLQPFEGNKQNIKDGFIERLTHGAQHASRTSLWLLLAHNHLQSLRPDYVNEAFKTIANHINLSEEQTLLVTLMTMGCHDIARKGEGRDVWETESAAITLVILKQLGVEEKHALLFSAAVEFKDQPSAYKNVLKNLGIPEQEINKFDYIRKLINLGDNLDLMRCVGYFKSKFIFDTLASIDGFEQSHHDAIIDLMKAIHQFIFEQDDMIFGCDIVDITESKLIASHKIHFSKKEKVKYEHAENVFSVIFEQALTVPAFEPWIKHFVMPRAKQYQGQAAFNPFIHGSNTSIFSILPKSEFNIMSPLEMLDDYLAVSPTGELKKGGYGCVGMSKIKDAHMGKTSFAILSTNDNNAYTLKQVLSNYAYLDLKQNNNCLADFKGTIQPDRGFKHAFEEINLSLIYLARARQAGYALEDIISKDELESLREQMDACAQYFYFLQLLGTYIHPDFQAVKDSGLGNKIAERLLEFDMFSFKTIVEKIIKSKINMQEIVENPSVENLNKALSVLEFPENHTIRAWGWGPEENITLPITQFFCLKANYPDNVCNYETASYKVFSFIARNSSDAHEINRFLRYFLSAQLSSSFFISIGEYAKNHLIAFEDRRRLFEKLISTPQEQFKLTDLQNYYLQNKFPVILISEDENKILIDDFSSQEYRSQCRLKIGKDIKMIATDTKHHQLELMKYLELHEIRNVQIILFDDLKKSKISHKKPQTPYHHSDGVPSLKWISAKAATASANYSSFFYSETTKIRYPDQNIRRTAQALLNDAEEYKNIEFESKQNRY